MSMGRVTNRKAFQEFRTANIISKGYVALNNP